MTIYAIGDVQGCFDSLQKLLSTIKFKPGKDKLWFAGDLINRGPKSLQTLRFIRSLGSSAEAVLGNHDLHALAVYYGKVESKSKDTLSDLFKASDAPELFSWLLQQSLAKYHPDMDIFMSHAGMPPQWSVKSALAYAKEVESVLQSSKAKQYFANMYGNRPDRWSNRLKGCDRLRVITNYFTRMRFIDPKGRLDLVTKQGIDNAPKGYDAWFNYPRKDKTRLVFGHWAAIQGITHKKRFVALDTGCVWGWRLRAYALDSGDIFEVAACD